MSANCPTPACLGTPAPETFGHFLSVLWTYLFLPLGSIALAFWVYVFIVWRWRIHEKNREWKRPRFFDERHDR